MDGYLAVLASAVLVAAILAMSLAFRRHLLALAGSRRDSLTDTLTGLGNRRRLLEDLGDALADPGRAHLLLVLDLDGFKTYNDVHGHPAGDALLARLGRQIEAGLPPRGTAYRLGGDEFCALLEDRGAERAELVAALERSLSESGDGLAASHGIVAIPEEADTPERALELADHRLYDHKAERHPRTSASEVRDALAEALDAHAPGRDRLDPVTELAGRVARELGLRGEQLELVVRAAELRDVGKAAIPHSVLDKSRPLDEAERELLRHHTLVGERMLSSAEALCPVAVLVRACDERFDGSGHPDGVAGEEIPLGARIVAACEDYDALSARGHTRRRALLALRREAGSRFDPEVVEALAAASGPPAAFGRRKAQAATLATLALGGALLMLLPASALAGSARIDAGKLRVSASPGQDNKLTIEAGTDSRGSGALVREAGVGASITPGPGCSNYAPGQVYCSLPHSISVDAGDGDDSVVVYSWLEASLRGGTGDDALYGSGGRDQVEGQEGNDTLGGGFGGDTLRGGTGVDTVNFAYYTNPVTVDLDGVADDGAAGEKANVMPDVENVLGGKGADTLTGDADSNLLDGGAGRDDLRGDAGGDTLRARDGERDEVACGSGDDAVTADAVDALATDCDTSLLTSIPAPLPAPLAQPLHLEDKPVRVSHKGFAPVRLRCTTRPGESCRGTVTIDTSAGSRKRASASAARRVLGKARFSARRGRVAVVKVRISRNGRRRVLRRRKLRCRASVAIRRSDGSRTIVRTVLTLTAAKGGS